MTLIDPPFRARAEAQHVARIHVVTPREEIQSAMRAALDELQSALQTQGIAPNGPWLTVHRRRPTDTFDLDICFPIGEPVRATGRVEDAQTEASEVIRTVFHGDYARLAAAWAEFMRWIGENGYETREGFFEVYTVGPEADAHPAAWCTELNCPLAIEHANPHLTEMSQ